MTSSIIFSFCSLTYLILIIIVYMSKPRMKNEENKIYLALLFVNLFILTIEIIATLVRYRFPNMVLVIKKKY